MILMQRGSKITVTSEVGEKYASYLRSHLRAALEHVKRAPPLLSVAIVSTRIIIRLNREFLGKPRVTDVLAFEISRDARQRIVEAEVVVCLGEAMRQARLRGHPVENELLLYALHGLLHLCGYDDASPERAARMHAREDQILEAIGIGPVFAPGQRSKRASRGASAVAVRRRPS